MPRYWRFLFGDPKGKSPYGGGIYPVAKTGQGKKQDLTMIQRGIMRKGDRALLYCTSSYAGHRLRVVGDGEITGVTPVGVNNWHINYVFRGFKCDVPWETMLALSTPLDAGNLRRLKYMWIVEVSPVSFQNIVHAGSKC